MGDADGVRAGEHHEVVRVELLGLEAGHELRQVEGRRREELERLGFQGHVAVEATRRDRVVDPGAAEEVSGVAGGEGERVGAGDDARARALEDGLGFVDHLEAPEAREVWRADLLGPWVGWRWVEKYQPVAAVDEAVVEGHADQARAEARVRVEGLADHGPNNVLRRRTAALVVADPELAAPLPAAPPGGMACRRRLQTAVPEPARTTSSQPYYHSPLIISLMTDASVLQL